MHHHWWSKGIVLKVLVFPLWQSEAKFDKLHRKSYRKDMFLYMFQVFGGLVPQFVSWLPEFFSKVLGLVCWVLGLVFWVLEIVFWVLGLVFWGLGLVVWVLQVGL